MTAARAATVAARMASLSDALAFVEAFCAECGVGRDDGLRLALIVEELLTNTVVHGHGGDCDAPVRIALAASTQHVEIVYEDGAPPFDPVAHGEASAAELDGDVGDRPVGQLGLALILSFADEASYARDGDLNRLRLALRRQP